MSDLWDGALTVSVTAAFLSSLTFVVVYHVMSRGGWFGSAVGRNQMMLVSCLALVFGIITSIRVFDRFPLTNAVILATYSLVTVLMVHRTVLVIRAQRSASRAIAEAVAEATAAGEGATQTKLAGDRARQQHPHTLHHPEETS